jgi:hypothetical protein
MIRWQDSPVAFVLEVFGPGYYTEYGRELTIDSWQREALMAVARNPKVAMSACKGPGKSCVLAWVILWFLATQADAQVMALSITRENLRDNLWKELALWMGRSPMLQAAFEFGATRISSREKEKTWWVSGRAFAQQADTTQQTGSLAGFHGEHIMIVLDEVGDYPLGVLSAAEAIFANATDAHLVVAGNPTRTDGPLYQIVTLDASRWYLIHITGDPDDPKRSPRIDRRWAQSEIDKWGRDNPWVMVNILGMFPPASADQLIGVNLVTAAMQRDVSPLQYSSASRVWGLDPARFGDDEIVLCRRQGVVCRRFHVWRNLNGNDIGNRIGRLLLEAEKDNEFPDAVFVDCGGNGASAVDRLEALGWGQLITPVDFGSRADDERFGNKRAEIWWAVKDWLKDKPACLPVDPVLRGELPAPKYMFKETNKRTVFLLEKKESMRARGVPSPNRADALALTFAEPVMPLSEDAQEYVERQRAGQSNHALTEYDPFDEARF